MNKLIIGIVILAVSMWIYISKQNTSENFISSYRPIHQLPYNEKYYNKNKLIPQLLIKPGFNEIDYNYVKEPSYQLQYNNNKFCNANPLCYPCPGWRFMGNPMCPK